MIKLVKDIIALKTAHGILEADATDEKIDGWYSWVLANDHCVAEYEGRDLVGFAEWIRLPEIPKTMKGITDKVDWKVASTAPVLLITNMIATQPGMIRKMMGKMRKKIGMDWKYMVWHNKRKDKMFVTTRGQRCLI